VARQATASETIEQAVVMFKASRREREGSEKRAVLRALIEGEGSKCTNAIVFCNRKTDVDICAKSLKKYGYDAEPIHGDLDQSQRTRTLDGFREGNIRILVASDVAARGLDVPSVSHVFNFDVPSHAEDYVHRIGRTGRAGRDGKTMMICAKRDEKNFDAIEKLIQKEIPRIENPNAQIDDAQTQSKPRRSKAGSEAEQPKKKSEKAVVQNETREKAPAQTKDRNRSRKNQSHSVAGMGDHMPSFIALSFEERRTN